MKPMLKKQCYNLVRLCGSRMAMIRERERACVLGPGAGRGAGIPDPGWKSLKCEKKTFSNLPRANGFSGQAIERELGGF
jgi:hypothetical protein